MGNTVDDWQRERTWRVLYISRNGVFAFACNYQTEAAARAAIALLSTFPHHWQRIEFFGQHNGGAAIQPPEITFIRFKPLPLRDDGESQ